MVIATLDDSDNDKGIYGFDTDNMQFIHEII